MLALATNYVAAQETICYLKCNVGGNFLANCVGAGWECDLVTGEKQFKPNPSLDSTTLNNMFTSCDWLCSCKCVVIG